MATYTIQIPGAQLSDQRKAALPDAIKDAHAKTTGAPCDTSLCTAYRWSAIRSSSTASSPATRAIPSPVLSEDPERFVLRIGFPDFPLAPIRSVVLDARVRHGGAILRPAGHRHPARFQA
jgi:hypothetical protein